MAQTAGSSPPVGSSRIRSRGVAEDRLREAQALAHALGVAADALIGSIGEADLVEQLVNLVRGCGLQAGEQGQHFAPGHRAVEGDVLRQERNVFTRVVAAGTIAEHGDFSVASRCQTEDHFEKRGLASTVMTDQGDALAGVQLERHIIDRGLGTKALGDVIERKNAAAHPLVPVTEVAAPLIRGAVSMTPPG